MMQLNCLRTNPHSKNHIGFKLLYIKPIHIALICAFPILSVISSSALARVETIALGGQVAPSTGDALFDSFSLPSINEFGQVTFAGNYKNSTSVSAPVFPAIFQSTNGGLSLLVSQQTINSGQSFDFFGGYQVNNVGALAFVGLDRNNIPNAFGIYRYNSTSQAFELIALEGGYSGDTGSFYSRLSTPSFNDYGQIAFKANMDSAFYNQAIFITQKNETEPLSVAEVGRFNEKGVFSNFDDPVLNNQGQVAFRADTFTGTQIVNGQLVENGQGIFIGTEGVSKLIAFERDIAPGTNGDSVFSRFGLPVLNNAGQIAFTAEMSGFGSTRGIFLSNDGFSNNGLLKDIALQGQNAVNGAVGTFSDFSNLVLNDAGQILFRASITGGASNTGLFRSESGNAITTIAVQGQRFAGSTQTFETFSTHAMNEKGTVLFLANITGNQNGLFLGDGREIVTAQLKGDTLSERTIEDLSISSSLNKYGQFSYRAFFSDGTFGVYVYTPELRWRDNFSGNWEFIDFWTLGLRPEHVHDVRIDPNVSLTVNGPNGQEHIKSLVVGSGDGFATLNLSGGQLTASNGVQIARRGILAGEGTLNAQVVNSGTILADNIIINGGLINQGTLKVAPSNNQNVGGSFGNIRLSNETIQANLTNQSGGIVRVDAGQSLKINGTIHQNSGNFEIRSGELQINGSTTNNASGRILFNGTGSIARFNDGLINNGQLQVGFGSAEIFGNITTQSGGKIILSGYSDTTFYDTVTVNTGGELRVSSGSNAIFFGQVLQRTGSLFTGLGNKFYEGGLSVGNSPGLGVDAGNVSFGAFNQYLAEIGGTFIGDTNGNGLQYDRYIVNGTLTLGGTLKLVSWNSFIAESGQSFDLFDWGNLIGKFDLIDTSGFNLASGAQLDLSRLYVDGTISVTPVPEPNSYALMLAGLGFLGFSKRKRV